MNKVIIIFFLLITLKVSAQIQLSTKSKKAIELYTEADNYRVRGQFPQAISLLKQSIEKDKEFVEAYYRLGIVYMSMKDFNEANKYFEKGLSLTTDVRKQKVFWFDMAESYFTLGEYTKAQEFLNNFLSSEQQNKPKIDRAKQLLNNARFAQENKDVKSAYNQRPLSDTVNSFAMQYFPVLTADQQEIIFTRRLGNGPDDDEDLVISRKDKNQNWSIPASISKNINSDFNEGTCTISADGRKLIFTSCVGRPGFGSCDLFESIRIGNEWTTPKNLGPNVNSSEWESQPSLSADGRTLYFVSDRRGGAGRRDIWVSTVDAKGDWGKARNAGKPINTVYDEISPFIHVNNRSLYFASNGLTGYDGYDIFFSERDSANAWGIPKNLGAPINTHEDQFSLFITADGKKGYYSHEEQRPNLATSSRIFEVSIPEGSQVRFKSNYVKGIVRDRQTKKPLSADIELINLVTNEVESLVKSDSITGEYLMVLTQGSEYGLYVNKREYLFKSLNFNYSEVKDFKPITLDIELDRIREGSTATLQNLFFEVDKFELKEKSKAELQTLIRFLQANPQAKVEISGHTDNSGAQTYNQQLSEKRAKAVYEYLVNHGVAKSRLVAKGYGSERPITDNTTEEGRQRNRRIEFTLLK